MQIMAPVVRGRKGRHEKVLEQAKKSGYVRARIDAETVELSDEIALDKNQKHTIEIIVDRLIVRDGIRKRLADSLETALELTGSIATASCDYPKDAIKPVSHEEIMFSSNFACPNCGISIDEIEPRSFSFNNPFGACPDCLGLGYTMEFDEDLIIPDKTVSISDGAIVVPGWQSANKKGYSVRRIS